MLLQINSHQIRDNAIITQLIADANVTNAKLASGIDAAKIADGSVSNTEFQYLDGVSSPIQTQINSLSTGASSASTDISNLQAAVGANDLASLDYGTPNYVTSGTDALDTAVGKLDAQIKVNTDGLATEITNRTAADTTLQSNIDAEATARANADTSLQSNIDAEATTRANADTTLQSNIDAEATARANADTSLQSDIDTLAGGDLEAKVNRSGDTMTGPLLMTTNTVAGDAALQVPTKGYVDGLVSGLLIKTSVRVATTVALPTNTMAKGGTDTAGTGTVSSTGTAVTGTGTAFTTQLAVGQMFSANGEDRQITAIADDTNLTVNAAFTSDLSGAAFTFNADPGVGATLTADANGAFPTVDDVTLVVGDRILVKDEPQVGNDTAGSSKNGVFVVTDLGSVGTPWILTRATDFDDSPDGEVVDGSFVFVGEGTVNGDNGFVQTDNSPVSVNSIVDGQLVFTQFSGAGQIIAGAAISKTGNQLDVEVDNSTIEVNGSDQLRIKDGGVTTAKIADGAVTDAKIDTVSASKATYTSGATTPLTSTNVASALDELKNDLDAATAGSGTDVSALQAAVGSSTGLAGLDYSSNSYVTDGTSLETAVGALDAALTTEASTRASADSALDTRVTSLESFQANADADYVNVTGDTMTGHLEINTTSGNGGITIKGNDDSTYGGQVNVISDTGRIQVRGITDANSYSIIDKNSLTLQSTFGGSKVVLSGGGNNQIQGNLTVSAGNADFSLDSNGNYFQITDGNGNGAAFQVNRTGHTTDMRSAVHIISDGTGAGTLAVDGLATLSGGATIPTGKVITITDAPTANTDGANKAYVDAAEQAAKDYADAQDAAAKTTADADYVNVTGDTMSGALLNTSSIAVGSAANSTDSTNITSSGIRAYGSGLNNPTAVRAFLTVGQNAIDTPELILIKNSDSTIISPNAATFGGSVTVTGDLTVNGTVTHVNSTTVDIDDNVIVLNDGVATNAANSTGGIQIKRLDTDNTTRIDAVLRYNETSDKWEAGNGVDDTGAGGDVSALVRYAELNAVTGAAQVGYDNTTSGLSASDVQAAIDELRTLTGGGATDVSALQAAVGSSTGLAGLDYSSNNYVTDGTSLEDAIGALDAQLGTTTSDLATTASDLATEITNRTNADTAIRNDLASTATSEGASLVGIEDAGAYFTATTVEGALQELAAAGADAPLHPGYDELLVDSTIETANASAAYDITLSNSTTLAGQFVKVFINGALQVFDNGSNGTMPTAYTKTAGNKITIKQSLLTAGDVIQIHYNY